MKDGDVLGDGDLVCGRGRAAPRSVSSAPRSASRSSARESSKSARNSTSGRTRRWSPETPSAGAEASGSVRPRFVAECSQPCGPEKSTSLRAASAGLRRSRASSSRSCQPASLIGALRAQKMVHRDCSLQAADSERPDRRLRTTSSATSRRRRRRRAASRRIVEELEARDEEQVAGHRRREVEEPVVVAGRLADEHVGQHLLDHVRVASVPDEIRPELARADRAERHVEAQDLPLLPVLADDRVQRDVRVRGLDVVGQLDVAELRAADRSLLVLHRQRIPRLQVVQVLLDDHVAAARRTPDPRRRSAPRRGPRRPPGSRSRRRTRAGRARRTT